MHPDFKTNIVLNQKRKIMKSVVVFVMAMVVSAMAFGQHLKETQVPAATRSAFQKAYPHTAGKWEKENGNYEVSFHHQGKTMSAVVDGNGGIVETETGITMNDMPKDAKEYLKKHYGGAKITETAKIVKADGSVVYEAEVHKKDVLFDANGKFIKEAKD
jgi:hypothetical protein